MCGIAGIALRQPKPHLRDRFVELSLKHLARRGPDAQNRITYHPTPNVEVDLIHTRLSIIDLAGGVQPMSDDNGALVFNGEIYNYRDIRLPGESYRTSSDTEVLLKGLGRESLSFLNKTEGMFGFGYLDQKGKKLVVARDQFGIKPVYIYKDDTTFAFASTLAPLMAMSRKEINPDSLVEYYTSRGMRSSNTIFKDVIEVAPGYAFILDLDTWTVETVKWALPRKIEALPGTEEDLIDALEKILDESVKRHLISDVPVAALLSGGIDSGLMTAFAARHTNHLSAFTIGFRDAAYDESQHAAAVAQRYGLKHHVMYCEDDEFIDLIADWPLIMDDAVANPSTVLLYALSRFAREAGYKVLLAGEGADEFFGGYHQQWRFAMAKKLNPAARFFPSIADGIERFAPHRTRLIHAAKLATGDCTFHGSSMIVEPWLAKELFAVPVGDAPFANTLNEALLLDQDYRLPDDMLTAADRATMHASVEARVPFVTRAVADFAASLEERHLISGFSQKVLLRKLARRHIPASCIDRRKVGFDLPLSRWFRTSLKERLLDALANTWQREFFKEGALDKLVEWHLTGRANIPDKLWAFYLLEHNVRALRAIS
jgi:asparagine synthase (glutamine-hydrolysing)